MERKTVLITGGGGFLGSHLAEFYLRQNRAVVCVDNFATGLRSNKDYLMSLPGAAGNLKFVEADVTQTWSSWLPQIAEKAPLISHVFHFASPASPPHYQRLSIETMWVNTWGLQNAMLFADSVGARVTFASTSEIYGDPAISPQPEDYWGNVNTQGPRSCYDEAKRFGEALLYSHNKKFKTKHGLVRIFNTYGPRMNPNDGRVMINFLLQALKGESLTIFGDGKQTRSFCYVSDLIAGIDRYAHTELTVPVNIGNDREFTISDLAQTVREMFSEKNLELKYFPLPKDDPRQRRPDLTRARSMLDSWEPKIHLKEGISQMLQWLKTQDLEAIRSPALPE